jgi:hypothetical protein
MGIDLKAGGRRCGHNTRKAPVTKNVYIKLLEKLYRCVEIQSPRADWLCKCVVCFERFN